MSACSVSTPLNVLYVRANAWSRVASDLKPAHLDLIVNRAIAFDDLLPQTFAGYVDGQITGRTIVHIGTGEI